MQFHIQVKVVENFEIAAETAEQAIEKAKELFLGTQAVPRVEVTAINDAEVLAQCEGCGKYILNEKDLYSDSDGIEFCKKCWDELVEAEKNAPEKADADDESDRP